MPLSLVPTGAVSVFVGSEPYRRLRPNLEKLAMESLPTAGYDREAEIAVIGACLCRLDLPTTCGLEVDDFRPSLQPIFRGLLERANSDSNSDESELAEYIVQQLDVGPRDLADWLHAGLRAIDGDHAPTLNAAIRRIQSASLNRKIEGITGEPVETRTFRNSDIGNAERFVHVHGNDLKFCSAMGGWLYWDCSRWREDATGEALRRAIRTVLAMGEEAQHAFDCGEEEFGQALLKWQKKSEGRALLSAMLALAIVKHPIPVEPDKFDTDLWLFNTANGTIDLRTGLIGPHRRGDLITKLCAVEFDVDARCDRWLTFLSDIMMERTDLVDYLQRAVGYTLTGDTSEQNLFILHGGGANGKSTLVNVLEALFGDYCQPTSSTTLMATGKASNGPTPEIAMLKGARFVPSVEVQEGRRIEEGLIKKLTGGDSITADKKYRDAITFKPTFKIWLVTNHLPVIRLQDEGTWRRPQLIPFDERYLKGDPRRDDHLEEKLMEELPGILAWAVKGCLQWQEQGLAPPAEVLAATQDYRESQDTLGQWLEECCESGHGFEAEVNSLYSSYSDWSKESGEKTISKKMLGILLGERGYQVERRGRSRRFRLGLRIKGEPSQTTITKEPS